MATEALDSGPVGPSDTTVDLTAATNSETEDEGHEPYDLSSNEYKNYVVGTDINKLRLGVTAACQVCSIVLDAITTYSTGRLCMDSMTRVNMLADSWRICIIKGEDERTELELFRLQGKLYTYRFVCFQ